MRKVYLFAIAFLIVSPATLAGLTTAVPEQAGAKCALHDGDRTIAGDARAPVTHRTSAETTLEALGPRANDVFDLSGSTVVAACRIKICPDDPYNCFIIPCPKK